MATLFVIIVAGLGTMLFVALLDNMLPQFRGRNAVLVIVFILITTIFVALGISDAPIGNNCGPVNPANC